MTDGIMRNAAGNSLVKGTKGLNPSGRPRENWRRWLRKETQDGQEIHLILLALARGQPRTVTLLDGREHIIVPTAEVSARCAIHLDEMLNGKAVTQNEQQKAEREASHMAAVAAMSDEELERKYLEARAEKDRMLVRGEPLEDAQLVSSEWVEVFDAVDSGLHDE